MNNQISNRHDNVNNVEVAWGDNPPKELLEWLNELKIEKFWEVIPQKTNPIEAKIRINNEKYCKFLDSIGISTFYVEDGCLQMVRVTNNVIEQLPLLNIYRIVKEFFDTMPRITNNYPTIEKDQLYIKMKQAYLRHGLIGC